MEQTATQAAAQPQSLSTDARTYFLKQGSSIQRLHEILDSNFLTGVAKRGISILIELVLFLVFVAGIALAVYIPTVIESAIPVTESTTAEVGIRNKETTDAILLLKAGIVVLSLVPLAFMMVLKRNRRKGALIQEAYFEVEDMKKEFDNAVKGLRL
jgi:hypothetical protein